ncbi:alkane hydroxylase MAH1-like [Hordeum vulgare subsp. vulgare]|uniref:alkane hydroxylase MAH1-like n=1 Tax=Hordeum vulgare subsp. vulgare TaxID=112509 RepID=UPI001D1A56C3|nr:alkane hydroxylase MAH1-like [Hordeum vulgare subsp. vulgare]
MEAVSWLRRRDGLPTNWPVVGSLPAISVNAGRVHEWLTEFLRVAPGMSHVARGPWGSPVDMLITANPADVAHVFTINFGNYPKGEDFAAMFDVLGNGIFNADGDSWAFQRRKAHALLSDARFRAAVAASTARKLDDGLVPLLDGIAAGGAVVDLQDVFMRLTFDLTAMFIFGTDPGCLAADFPRVPFAAAMDEAEAVLFYRHVTPVAWLKLQTYLNVGHHKKMTKAQQVLDASIAEFVSLRRERAASADSNADGSDAADLLTLYLACQDEIGKDGREFDRFLRDTTLNLMIAGRDTTSSALTWFFWLLSNHPDVEAKILAELRQNLPSSGGGGVGHHPSAADLKRLAYLHAALSESLRLYPPVPFEHKAGAQPDTLPSGPAVRPWRRVIVSFYSMGRMEAVWGKDCLEFRPERWLTAAGRLRHEPSYKFVAFNVGPRTCIGKELAFTQMKAVVAAVLPRFRVEVAPGAPAVKPKLSIILHMKDGLKVRVYKRQGGASQGYVRT